MAWGPKQQAEGLTPRLHWPTAIDPWFPNILTGPQSGKGRRVIFDIEGDGLLYASGSKKQVTQVWCLAAVDWVTGEEFYWGVDQGNVEDGVRFLAECEVTVGHNAIGYDYPALERLYPWFKRPAKAWDSIIIAKAYWPPDALVTEDMKLIARGRMPGHMLKRHSLEAWGYRTGTHKGDYEGGFDEWCPAMAEYLMGDIRGTLALWRLILRKLGWLVPEGQMPPPIVWPERAVQTECDVARIIHEQWECGVRFDVDKALLLASELRSAQARIEAQLVETFGSWWEPAAEQTVARTHYTKCMGSPDITVPRISEKTGKPLKPYVGPPLCEWTEGSVYQNITRVTFSPSNRHHLGQRLQEVYGWKPKAFGKNGQPTVDEGTLEEIPEAVLPAHIRKLILDYFVVSKTMAMLCGGNKNWIKMSGGPEVPGSVRQFGRIHSEMDTVGAVTRRGIHKNPNLGQVPSVQKAKGPDGKEHILRGLDGGYGWECRELFCADEGWEQTGVDASSLELIDLGHYLHPLDGGAFSARVCDPLRDPHKEHAEIAGGMTRAEAKTTIYLKVYGGSAYKLSLALDVGEEEMFELLRYKGLPLLLKNLAKRFDEEFVAKLDDRQRAKISKARQIIVKLEAGIVGLKELAEAVSQAAERGFLKALDGSRIYVRKAHAALNSLLQSAGALSCKLWMVLVHQELERRGLRKGVDWKQLLWVHDELQFTHRPGLGPIIKEVAEQCMVLAGEMLGLRGRYRTSGATGRNWAECH